MESRLETSTNSRKWQTSFIFIDAEGKYHNFQVHSIENPPEDYLPTKDSYYEFEPEDVNKENLSLAEMSGKKLDWFRKVCAAVL